MVNKGSVTIEFINRTGERARRYHSIEKTFAHLLGKVIQFLQPEGEYYSDVSYSLIYNGVAMRPKDTLVMMGMIDKNKVYVLDIVLTGG